MKSNSSIATFLGFVLAAFAFSGFATIVSAQEQGQFAPQPDQELLSADQLNNLVAPIALYPDPLLSQMLVASTYPLEVVEASQWLKRNSNLKGQALVDAAKEQPWDPSVQALVAIPDALDELNQDIRWTADLGNAFLSQREDVMNAVQQMRTRAQSKGRLRSTPQQIVTTETQDNNQVVIIQPAHPDVIYVPVYDPIYVWGPPVYGFYPRLRYPSLGFGFGTGYDLGFYFSDWNGWGLWGWGPNWFSNVILIDTRFFRRYGFHDRPGGDFRGRTVWAHNPEHRLNVPYRNGWEPVRSGGRVVVASASRSETNSTGRAVDQGKRSVSLQGQGSQDPPRQRSKSSTQYQPQPQQYRATPQVQKPPTQTQRSYQSPQSRSAPQIYRAPQTHSAPQVQRVQSQAQPRSQASPQYRSAPQTSVSRSSAGSINRSGGGKNHR
jgi:hypothetical protein